MTELRTQNPQLHQALQQMQQLQAQQQGLVQELTDLPQSLAQTVGAAVVAATNPARANSTLVDTRGLGKPPPLKNTESEFVSWARRTENLAVSLHRGARYVLTWAVERESATVALDASGHSANAGRSAVHSADDPRGERVVRHPCGFWIGRRTRSLAASAQTMGPPDDGKSKRIAQRDPLSPCVFLIMQRIFIM